eukprot:TRINITY_DN14081_c0_g2_i3.p1 TRINITY_DN14081_c0_g2~~TRINITY_DN14081_c0_g2_i3.p1  ORF type:complete len:297 (-),score=23.97 TRINITY_DN14081_c0_g2_i3:677-1567(-)
MKDHIARLAAQAPNDQARRSVVREYIQARILQCLQEKGAFVNWAFLGGTALRFLYGIPRYSEDLDFSVVDPDADSGFRSFLQSIQKRFLGEGYDVNVKVSDRKVVKSAFVRLPGLLYDLQLSPRRQETLSVKLELDSNPPAGAVTETTLIRRYLTLNLSHYDKASLLAGKLHAILSRPYTKGRDIYDLVWFLSDPTWPLPNWRLLNAALKQTDWQGGIISHSNWLRMLSEKLRSLDWSSVRQDVRPFLERESELALLNQGDCLGLLSQTEQRGATVQVGCSFHNPTCLIYCQQILE